MVIAKSKLSATDDNINIAVSHCSTYYTEWKYM